MNKRVIAPLFVVALATFFEYASAAKTTIPNFAPGQEWSIKSSTSTTAKVVIGRVDRWGGKIAVHVSIIDIPVPQGFPDGGSTTRIGHVAFDEAALRASVDRLLAVGISPAPSFETGYGQWKAHPGDLTVMSVPQTIVFALAALEQSRP